MWYKISTLVDFRLVN